MNSGHVKMWRLARSAKRRRYRTDVFAALVCTAAAAGGETFPPRVPIPGDLAGVGRQSHHGPGGAASETGACCLIDAVCEPAADVLECNGLGGVFLPGEDCATGPCAPAACCDGLNCGTADAFACITAGRTYAGAGVTCFDDPCEAGIGACCLDGGCADLSPEACDGIGGEWLGAGTSCAQEPCTVGSCCTPGDCSDLAEFQCTLIGGAFTPGVACSAEEACQVFADCPTDSLFSQARTEPGFFTAYTSEAGASLRRSENFGGVIGAIDSLVWFGLELTLQGNDFVPCTEGSTQFEITVYEDDAGFPGVVVCTHVVNAARIGTGVDYLGVELEQYIASLPEPCVLTNGWISIVGLGDPFCWFLWMSSPDGDDRSICDGCVNEVEQDDLAVCLVGDAGGLFGSCCNLSTGGCVDDVEIVDCAQPGTRFTPDEACGDLDPACEPAFGACCFLSDPCIVAVPDDCAAAGGTWQGDDSTCDACPAQGGCCLDFDTCEIFDELVCVKSGGTWSGPDTTCDDCPAAAECPGGTLYGQLPNGPDDFLAGTSEAASAFQRYEDFIGVTGPIESLTWWGLDLEPIGGNSFIECVENDPSFVISFHEDAGGVPGAEVCSDTVLATRVEVGLQYLGADLNVYTAVLPEPCVITSGWVSILGVGDPDCWFLWMSSDQLGDSWCDGCIPPDQGIDLAVCLEGTAGGVLGACCNVDTAECVDDVAIDACVEAGLEFSPNATCDEIDPPCGVIVGACCFDDGTPCAETTEPECDDADGSWLGGGAGCDACPCVTPCPPGGLAEGETACFDGYFDDFNGGCGTPEPAFSPIAVGQTICGESGAFDDGESFDFDWYEVKISSATQLQWTVAAEFRAQIWIRNAAGGCPGTVLATEIGFECDELTVSANVQPGVYWLVVAAWSFSDSSACGARYTAAVSVPCPADVDGDGTVGVGDLTAVIVAWGTDDPDADVSGNGIVGVEDLTAVIVGWGDC